MLSSIDNSTWRYRFFLENISILLTRKISFHLNCVSTLSLLRQLRIIDEVVVFAHWSLSFQFFLRSCFRLVSCVLVLTTIRNWIARLWGWEQGRIFLEVSLDSFKNFPWSFFLFSLRTPSQSTTSFLQKSPQSSTGQQRLQSPPCIKLSIPFQNPIAS
jgi:hypothetical protein